MTRCDSLVYDAIVSKETTGSFEHNFGGRLCILKEEGGENTTLRDTRCNIGVNAKVAINHHLL